MFLALPIHPVRFWKTLESESVKAQSMPLMQGASHASTNYSQTPLLNFPDLTGSNNRSASFAKFLQRLIVASLSFFTLAQSK